MRTKPVIRTPFNRARRQAKIANIRAHVARHPTDHQSEAHAAKMTAHLMEDRS